MLRSWQYARAIGLSAVLVGLWLSGYGGWLLSLATAPLLIGMAFYVWRTELGL